MPNLIHMLQTAEAIRKAGLPDWFQLVGLLHDMGKIMFLWGGAEDGQVGKAEGPQWALGGDTWVLGCRIPDCTVFPEFNALNPDMSDPRYNTELGIYSAHCGFDNLNFAYGHDEYLYQMLVGVFACDYICMYVCTVHVYRYVFRNVHVCLHINLCVWVNINMPTWSTCLSHTVCVLCCRSLTRPPSPRKVWR
ncbi:hypothetical protein EON65_01960 [archaeon]|nr:MAG: hypothetical protein EON65_01960 [archaeon]